ncbi:MAG: ABC transporter permease [Hyphomicrobiales bacterium]|nr:ABC transporter permease [Hyphomicrobiales bacterium]
MIFRGLMRTLPSYESWLYITWLNFLVRYRKTAIGPVWLLVGPTLFIAVLGLLFSRIGGVDTALFVPHLAIGLIVWTLINGFVTGSTSVFQRNRPQILQGNMQITDLVLVDVFSTILQFLHQAIIILAVFLIFGRGVGVYALVSLVGLALLIANGIWLTIVFGIVGARYRDLSEVVQAVMRIAFLATPILWMPVPGGRGGVLGAFLTFNPFHHFLELIRAPLLGNPIAPLSWLVVLMITVAGFALAHVFFRRFSRLVPLWV